MAYRSMCATGVSRGVRVYGDPATNHNDCRRQNRQLYAPIRFRGGSIPGALHGLPTVCAARGGAGVV